jgi:hypothetical protein
MQSRSARAFAPTATEKVARSASFAELLHEIGVDDQPAVRPQALAELAAVVGKDGIDAAQLASLLEALVRVELPPGSEEAVRLGAVARAVGRRRLIAAFDVPGPRRLGAVRLLGGSATLAPRLPSPVCTDGVGAACALPTRRRGAARAADGARPPSGRAALAPGARGRELERAVPLERSARTARRGGRAVRSPRRRDDTSPGRARDPRSQPGARHVHARGGCDELLQPPAAAPDGREPRPK